MDVVLWHDDIKFDVGMNVIVANEVHTRHSLLGLVSNGMKTDATLVGIFMSDGQPKWAAVPIPDFHPIVHLLRHPISCIAH